MRPGLAGLVPRTVLDMRAGAEVVARSKKMGKL